jgi:hypothetical protein
MLEGEEMCLTDREEYTRRGGDVAYAGVGCIHVFENRSGKRICRLESRAPPPQLHDAYRSNRD